MGFSDEIEIYFGQKKVPANRNTPVICLEKSRDSSRFEGRTNWKRDDFIRANKTLLFVKFCEKKPKYLQTWKTDKQTTRQSV